MPFNFSQLVRHPWFPWAVVFLLASLLIIEDGGTNARSRFAALRAMSQDYSFAINAQKDWTLDWAQTPDGNYYSNKPPGPMFLAFPLFWTLDRTAFVKDWLKSKIKGQESKSSFGDFLPLNSWHILPVVYVLQVLPFILVSLILYSATLETTSSSLSTSARDLSALALFFGSTASILMNSFLGHPLAAVFLLLLVYGLLTKNIVLTAFSFGFALLCDYGVAFLLPAYMIAINLYRVSNKEAWTSLAKKVVLGALFPGALWVWYHVACFGSPFSLPMAFQNPAHMDLTNDKSALWGAFRFIPDPVAFLKILFGTERGVLFTQPWIFPVFAAAVIGFRSGVEAKWKPIFAFAIFGLLGLLFMNAGFGAWHGGGTPGPRYISSILPIFAILMIIVFSRSSVWLQYSMIVGVAVSVAFRAIVYPDGILPPIEPIWPRYVSRLFAGETGKGSLFFVLIVALLVIGLLWSRYHNARIETKS